MHATELRLLLSGIMVILTKKGHATTLSRWFASRHHHDQQVGDHRRRGAVRGCRVRQGGGGGQVQRTSEPHQGQRDGGGGH